MNLQLFNFNQNEIRIIKDEKGNPWFSGKDVCDALEYSKYRDALSGLDRDERMSIRVDTLGGKQKTTFINEPGLYSLVFGSPKPAAKAFKRWVTHEVLPAIRKTGGYSLKSLILPEPTQWERTFPHEFMRQALRLYGYPYDSSKGTPQFVGHFINKYVYKCLDREMTTALKAARTSWQTDDEMAFLHQFLNEDGRTGLRDHLLSVVPLMAASGNIDQFDKLFERVYLTGNQLELYLR